jgi:predicted enzyme related to lactoylglutathione lyase
MYPVVIRWVTGFLDFPAATFEAGRDFWLGVTGYELSPPRGPRSDFATLVPPDGDAFLRVQRIYGGPAGCHLDVHADDWEATSKRAVGLGAEVLHTEQGLVVLRSPGGLPWCVVEHEGEEGRPAPTRWPAGHRSLVDQICLDIPASQYDAECRFWVALTGWELRESSHQEFRSLARPAGMPLRLLLQRTQEPPGEPVRAHLDLACNDASAEALRHQSLGATLVRKPPGWMTLRDPAGLEYCVTRRDPDTGLVLPRAADVDHERGERAEQFLSCRGILDRSGRVHGLARNGHAGGCRGDRAHVIQHLRQIARRADL